MRACFLHHHKIIVQFDVFDKNTGKRPTTLLESVVFSLGLLMHTSCGEEQALEEQQYSSVLIRSALE
jgi:hypothetical protein